MDPLKLDPGSGFNLGYLCNASSNTTSHMPCIYSKNLNHWAYGMCYAMLCYGMVWYGTYRTYVRYGTVENSKRKAPRRGKRKAPRSGKRKAPRRGKRKAPPAGVKEKPPAGVKIIKVPPSIMFPVWLRIVLVPHNYKNFRKFPPQITLLDRCDTRW